MRLSILIPNYNYGKYLAQAVTSVATSNYPSFEIVLVDDGSTDNSMEVALALQKQFPKLRVYRNETNQGIYATVERAISLAKGQYLHFLASDDYRLPTFIEKTMHVLESNPTIPICCSDHTYFDESDPEKLCCSRLLKSESPFHVFSPTDLKVIFRRSNFWIPGHTSIVKKEAHERFGGFNPQVTYHCDWVLLHHIALSEGVAYIPEKLAVMRCHPHSFSAQEGAKRQHESYLSLWHYFQSEKTLEKAFLEASLLRTLTKVLFFDFIIRPSEWKYYPPFFLKAIERRLAKKCKWPINQRHLDKLGHNIHI